MKNIEKVSRNKVRSICQQAEKEKTERAMGAGKKYRRGYSKLEPNDGPHILDRGENKHCHLTLLSCKCRICSTLRAKGMLDINAQ